MADLVMPSLGADMQAGTLVAFRKQPGQTISRGEIFAEVETDKGVIEVECFTPGVLEALLVEPGTKVPVGTKLAVLREAGEAAHAGSAPPFEHPAAVPEVQQGAAPAPQVTPSARRMLREHGIDVHAVHGSGRHGTITRSDAVSATTPAISAKAPSLPPIVSSTPSRRSISPLARRLAGERGISLEGVHGTGPGGSVIARDVERAALEVARSAEEPLFDAQARMRRAITQSMSRSKREIPHYYLSQLVDLGGVLAWLEAKNAQRAVPDRILAGVLFVRAVALAVQRAPELNAHWLGDGAPPIRDVHVGIAISLRGGGLVAPAIRDVATLPLDELAVRFKDVVNRARAGQLRASELSSPTISMTSLGERGVDGVFPIIIPPQVAMVGFGTIAPRPVVVDNTVVARPTVLVTLAADHRVSDGHRGGLFLAALANVLKEVPAS